MESTPPTALHASPAPSRTLVVSSADYRQALDSLIGAARSTLRIFDADGAQLEFNSPKRLDSFAAFLHANIEAKMIIIVRSIEHIEKRCPRFVEFLSLRGNQIAVYQTDSGAPRVEDCFLIADQLHFIRRAVQSHPRGVVIRDDEHETAPMIERFEQIQGASTIVSLTTILGL